MKIRPILFSTEMVHALLAGRKTQTRRIVKPQPPAPECSYSALLKKCPYGQPGDLLWVRETWAWDGQTSFTDLQAIGNFWYKADDTGYSPAKWKPSIFMPKEAARIFLRITDVRVERLQDISEEDAKAEGAQPSSHRCGGFGYYEAGGDVHECECQGFIENSPAIEGYKWLWESINGAGSWGANPWVWVISFERCEKPNLFI